jgi:hypothetical protein
MHRIQSVREQQLLIIRNLAKIRTDVSFLEVIGGSSPLSKNILWYYPAVRLQPPPFASVYRHKVFLWRPIGDE